MNIQNFKAFLRIIKEFIKSKEAGAEEEPYNNLYLLILKGTSLNRE